MDLKDFSESLYPQQFTACILVLWTLTFFRVGFFFRKFLISVCPWGKEENGGRKWCVVSRADWVSSSRDSYLCNRKRPGEDENFATFSEICYYFLKFLGMQTFWSCCFLFKMILIRSLWRKKLPKKSPT